MSSPDCLSHGLLVSRAKTRLPAGALPERDFRPSKGCMSPKSSQRHKCQRDLRPFPSGLISGQGVVAHGKTHLWVYRRKSCSPNRLPHWWQGLRKGELCLGQGYAPETTTLLSGRAVEKTPAHNVPALRAALRKMRNLQGQDGSRSCLPTSDVPAPRIG